MQNYTNMLHVFLVVFCTNRFISDILRFLVSNRWKRTVLYYGPYRIFCAKFIFALLFNFLMIWLQIYPCFIALHIYLSQYRCLILVKMMHSFTGNECRIHPNPNSDESSVWQRFHNSFRKQIRTLKVSFS